MSPVYYTPLPSPERPPHQRAFCIPSLGKNDILFAINDVLAQLTRPEAWQQIDDNALTPEETASLVSELLMMTCEVNAMVTGTVIAIATELPPEGTLLCDGTVYASADYPKLANVISRSLWVDTTVVDGETVPVTFRTPDLRDKFVICASDTIDVLETGGSDTVTLSVEHMPAHTHTVPAHTHTTQSHNHTFAGIGFDAFRRDGTGTQYSTYKPVAGALSSSSSVIVDAASQATLPAGSGLAHANMPPYVALKYVIVAE